MQKVGVGLLVRKLNADRTAAQRGTNSSAAARTVELLDLETVNRGQLVCHGVPFGLLAGKWPGMNHLQRTRNKSAGTMGVLSVVPLAVAARASMVCCWQQVCDGRGSTQKKGGNLWACPKP